MQYAVSRFSCPDYDYSAGRTPPLEECDFELRWEDLPGINTWGFLDPAIYLSCQENDTSKCTFTADHLNLVLIISSVVMTIFPQCSCTGEDVLAVG